MGNLTSRVTESVTGTRTKQPLTPETAGVLGADWQRLATKATQAENDMREVAEGAPAASAERDVQSAAKDIIKVSQWSRQKTNNRRLKQAMVSRTAASKRSSSKSHNDVEMEF
ncbi:MULTISPECIES: hypothetical protein [unclassified Corynebacterium]|uniref:hypothetical protein n=1 Tax=unclassified Corynebacterium TaxID=2624378 RepID=UPI0008A1E8C5|nr:MULTISPECIES: hypothetical protein [unclassified Corynebacterium]OFK66505.1 hypothetical protein HMPREF2807_09040 [Corynebacterium sp. HMSC074A09]OFP26480.1 hypothetical protein HMPREF2993_03485 [Corynebacterium sp. HMSC068G04]